MKKEPYPGLRPFTEQESTFFLGRQDDTTLLIEKILTQRLTLFFAASGVGKSSLLQASVIPQLRSSQGENLSVVYHTQWVTEPLETLIDVIIDELKQRKRLPESFKADLLGDDVSLLDLLNIISAFVRPPLILILDQFEEFFRYQKADKQAYQNFIHQLSDIIIQADIPISIVFSMREDFALELYDFKRRLPTLLFKEYYRLKRLDQESGKKAIEEPIKQLGYRYEPQLLDELLNDLLTREWERQADIIIQSKESVKSIEPPYLQIVCRQLWELSKNDTDKTLRLSTYLKYDRSKGFVKRYLQQVIDPFDNNEKQVASAAFDNLVGEKGTKKAATLEGLVKDTGFSHTQLSAVLNQLEQGSTRILRLQKRGKDEWYELYHDVFSESIIQWNQAWKRAQLHKKIRNWFLGISTGLTLTFITYDTTINATQQFLRTNPITAQIELYQGSAWPFSVDLFQQKKFLQETRFSAKDLQPNQYFKEEPVYTEGVQIQLAKKLAPVEMMRAYSEMGEVKLALKLENQTHKKSKHKDQLVKQLVRIHDLRVLDDKFISHKWGREHYLSENGFFKTALFYKKNLFSQQKDQLHLNNISSYKIKNEQLIYMLSDLNPPNNQILSLLDPLLKYGNPEIRYQASKILFNIQPSTKEIIHLLENPLSLREKNQEIYKSAINYLSETLPNSQFLSSIKNLLENKNSEVSYQIITTLTNLNLPPNKTKGIIHLLEPFLEHKSKKIRSKTIIALAKLEKSAEKKLSLLRTLTQDPDESVRFQAIISLARSLPPNKLFSLIEPLLKDPNGSVRSQAIIALAKLNLPSHQTLPLLEILLKDSDERVRSQAVIALTKLPLPPNQFFSLVAPRLTDSHGSVRSQAVIALAKLKLSFDQMVDLLKPRLGDSDERVRSQATIALSKLKIPFNQVFLLLKPFLKDKSGKVRSQAVSNLTKLELSSDQLFALLEPLLKDPSEEVRFQVAWILARIKLPKDKITFTTNILLKDSSKNVRQQTNQLIATSTLSLKEIFDLFLSNPNITEEDKVNIIKASTTITNKENIYKNKKIHNFFDCNIEKTKEPYKEFFTKNFQEATKKQTNKTFKEKQYFKSEKCNSIKIKEINNKQTEKSKKYIQWHNTVPYPTKKTQQKKIYK